MTGNSSASCLFPTAGSAGSTFAAALQYFAASQCLLSHNTLPEANISDCGAVDFIIIGAGSAGSVLANRLTEVDKWNVLLIDAGGDPPIESDIPALSAALLNTQYDWQFLTENNGLTDQGLINGSVSWPRGKMFGGSSSINANYYARGSDEDYINWYNAGNTEWGIDDVHRCFKKAESLQNINMLKDSIINEFYGRDGAIPLNTFNHTYDTYLKKVLESWDENGVKNVPDLNVANMMGSGYITVTAANGIRQSTNTAYIRPIANRSNLKIIKNALVTKILINNSSIAYGVEVEKDGEKLTFNASLEVIVSAGSINSPQLLMLSGIGPQEHLLSKNITCKVDSPMVGQNLQDHTIIPITIYGDAPEEQTTAEQWFGAMNYLANRQGYLAENPIATSGIAFFSTIDNATFPECQTYVAIRPKNSSTLDSLLSSLFRFTESVRNSITELNKNHALYYFYFSLLHPYSMGYISLNSSDPNDHPLIYPNYLDDARDLDVTVKGIKMVTQILNTTYFKSINAFLGRIDLPACNGYELDSEDYWRCISINLLSTVFHPSGTCKMGLNISMSVVDSRLRVHGMKNLRVCDASVMPDSISGNTNAPTIMTAERGSELIKEDYGISY